MVGWDVLACECQSGGRRLAKIPRSTPKGVPMWRFLLLALALFSGEALSQAHPGTLDTQWREEEDRLIQPQYSAVH